LSEPITSEAVRTCPQASASVHRVDKSRGEQNPPEVPPQAVVLAADPVPLEVRKLRVANGSQRKRDHAAVRMAEELEQLERIDAMRSRVACGEVADAPEVWARVLGALRAAVPESTFKIWLEPVATVAGDGTTLFLSAPDGIATWVERRYSTLIRDALQGTGYTDVQFVAAAGGGE